LEEKMEIIVPTLENGFIQTLCMAEDNTEELINFSRLFELEDKGGYVMAIEFGGGDGEGTQNKISASVQTQNHYIGYKNILKSICRCIVGPIMLNRLIVFIPNVSGEDGYGIKDSAIRLAKNFLDRVRNSIGNVKIGIGRYYKDILNSKKSYHEALQALLTASGSPDPILHIDDMVHVFQEIPDSESKFEHEIYTKAAEGDINSALLALDNIFSQIEDSSENLDCIRDKCIIMAADFTKRVGSVSHAFHSVLVRIMSAGSNTELKIILRNYVKQMMDELSVRRQKRINSIIEKADNYLAEHYSEDITLEETARAVNLSPYYFSRFYKEESGVNFIDRLIAIRIEKAKQYFEATDISLKEVSGMVGYSDPNYFSKLFKKTTGYTATEYREFYRK
jgi:two-component system response regulator YesN